TVQADGLRQIAPFVEVKGGWQVADDNLYRDTNPNNYLWGLYGGLQFTPSWSWNLGYQYHSGLKAKATQVHVKTSLIESAIRYDLIFTDSMGLYGRLGIGYWDMDKKQESFKQLTDQGFSPIGEIGINYQLTPNIYLNTGYQYIHGIGSSKTGEYDSHSLVIGASYHFGNKDGHTQQLTNIDPTPSQVVTQVMVMEPRQLSSITFGFDETNILPSEKDKLAETLIMLIQYPQAQIEIIGYTDPIGSTAYNDELSLRRAKQVALTLESEGIHLSRMIIRGEGEIKLDSNASPEDFSKSRRVDVQLLPFEYENNKDDKSNF
ncbi:OmpA family protein, partial [Vibrio metoecus]|uniref:OmpA family protein n=1 Tax=Vibrio metoecus TaxID=1481663 RepID=UPI00215B961C